MLVLTKELKKYMEPVFVLTSEMFTLIVLPILIFCSRILDVSLSTLRIIFVSKGMKHLSPIVGFFEVLIWLIAISQIMQNLGNWVNYIAYAGGFAAGTYVGLWIENKLAMGNLIIRVIIKKNPSKLIEFLRFDGYRATVTDAMGGSGPSKIVLTVVKRRDLKEVVKTIKKFNPKAFYSIEDVKAVSNGNFIGKKVYRNNLYKHNIRRIGTKRKGK